MSAISLCETGIAPYEDVVTAEGCLAGLICGENKEGTLAVLPIGVIKSEYQIFQGK